MHGHMNVDVYQSSVSQLYQSKNMNIRHLQLLLTEHAS